MSHTPGPWHPLCEISDLEGSNWRFTIGSAPRPEAYGGQVATAGWKDLTREETESNARLIAAAPELAEHASLLVRTIWDTFRHRGQESQWDALEECTKEMVEILKKAEGR